MSRSTSRSSSSTSPTRKWMSCEIPHLCSFAKQSEANLKCCEEMSVKKGWVGANWRQKVWEVAAVRKLNRVPNLLNPLTQPAATATTQRNANEPVGLALTLSDTDFFFFLLSMIAWLVNLFSHSRISHCNFKMKFNWFIDFIWTGQCSTNGQLRT